MFDISFFRPEMILQTWLFKKELNNFQEFVKWLVTGNVQDLAHTTLLQKQTRSLLQKEREVHSSYWQRGEKACVKNMEKTINF